MPPIEIHRVFLATDFSSCSLAALPHAVAVAQRFHAKLYLANVIPDEAYSLIPLNERDSALAHIMTHIEEQMKNLRSSPLLNDVPYEVLIDHGSIWPTLSVMIEKRDVDLLVLGTHGRRGIEKLLLGSTAEEILRLAQTPLLMVGPESSVSSDVERKLHHILHATDFSPESGPALRYAYFLAKEYGASLSLLHVAEDVWKEPLSTRLRAEDFFLERILEKGWKVADEGISVDYHVEFGPRADCILEIAAKLGSELIVIGVRGSRHPRIAAHLPGPTAYDVVTRAHCPVLVIRGGNQAKT